METKLLQVDDPADFWCLIDELLDDKSGFFHNRNTLLKAFKDGTLYSLHIDETEENKINVRILSCHRRQRAGSSFRMFESPHTQPRRLREHHLRVQERPYIQTPSASAQRLILKPTQKKKENKNCFFFTNYLIYILF